MSFLDRMKPKLLFKTDKAPELERYIGKTIAIGGKPVKIETIVGNRFRPQFYEINGEHLIGMLRFHAKMEGAKDITEEQFRAFEEMDIEAEKLPIKSDPMRMNK